MDSEASEPIVNERLKVAQLKWQLLLFVDSQSINLQCLAKTWIYLTPYVCIERIFESPPLLNNIIFWKRTLTKVWSPYLYAYFGTLCVPIGQLFEAQWVFKQSEEFEIDDIFLQKQRFVDAQALSKRLIVPRIIDHFGLKDCQKKRKHMGYHNNFFDDNL